MYSLNIARSIVECDQFDALGENGDTKEALRCLMELKKNSSSLTDEDKNYLTQAIRRINGGRIFVKRRNGGSL